MKELPYFQFYCLDWISGNIQLMDFETKGIFTDMCSYYWKNDCNLNISDLNNLLKADKGGLSQAYVRLKKKGIIEIDDNGDISIKFLKRQYKNRLLIHKKLVESGRKGGLKKPGKGGLSQALAKSEASLEASLKHIISDSNSLCFKGFSNNIKEVLLLWIECKNIEFKVAELKALCNMVKKAVDNYGEDAVVDRINQAITGRWGTINFNGMSNLKENKPPHNTDKTKLAVGQKHGEEGLPKWETI